MLRQIYQIAAFLFVVFISFNSFGAEFEPKGPLTLRTQNAIYLQFLNLEPTRAVTLRKGEFAFRIDNAYSNMLERGNGATIEEFLDMELLRTALHFNYGVYDNMEVGIEVPFLRFDGGFLDSFLQKYHNFFGFPNGGRELVPNNSFTYTVFENGAAIYDVPESNFNLGDVTLNFKHNFISEDEACPAVAWLFYFKFPTGNVNRGLGSGNPDFGFATALEKSYNRWHGYLNLGYFVNGGQKFLQNYVNDFYFTYVLGAEFSVSHPVSILAQIYGGTPLLKNGGFISWDSYPMDLQIGVKGEHQLKELFNSITWQLGFAEDLNANGPSVDISILGSIGFKFGL